ncbi:MAG: TolC family protein [Gemmatimonadaceae bacterium]
MLATICVNAAARAQSPGTDSLDVAPVLNQLVEAARIGSPSLRAARATLDAATARRRAAGLLPPFTLQAGVSDAPRNDVVAGNAQVQVERDLFLAARRNAARRVADVEVSAAERSLASQLSILRADVLRALARFAGAQRALRGLATSDQLISDVEAALQARFAVGQARYLDVLRARTERLQLRAEQHSARADAVVAFSQLASLVGRAVDSVALSRLADTTAADRMVPSWSLVLREAPHADSLVRLQPTVRQAEDDVRRAEAAVVQVAAGQRAQVTAYGGLQRIGSANGGLTGGLVAGLSTSLPFTARAANTAGRDAASADVAAAQAALAEVDADSRARVRALTARYTAAREQLALFDGALLIAAGTERETALAQYRAGGLPLIELLDFERALLRVRLAHAQAVTAAADAMAALLGAVDRDGERRP